MGVIPGAPHVAREGPGAGHQWRKATRRKGDGGKPADTHDRTHKGVTTYKRVSSYIAEDARGTHAVRTHGIHYRNSQLCACASIEQHA